jgi:hypothetical protein
VGTQPSHPVAPVRKTVIGREDVSRRPFTPRRRWATPHWLRRAISGLLVLFILPWLLGALTEEAQKPTGLATSMLVGPRMATGPVCIEEAVDLSASMTAYTPQRERAEAELFAFARRELAPYDLMSTAHFAGSAQMTLPPTSMDTLTSTPAPAGGLADGTQLAPAVDVLVNARTNADSCVLRALVVITDGAISDPHETAAALARGGYARVFAVIPVGVGWGAVDTEWGRPQALRGPLEGVTVHRFHDSGAGGRVSSFVIGSQPLDVVFGEIVSSLTGQQLEQNGQYSG